MLINGLPLPGELVADLQRGGLRLDKRADRRLRALLKRAHFDPDCPYFLSLDNIERENGIWTNAELADYATTLAGTKSFWHPPGNVDPRKVVNIGILGTDAAVALDYRVAPPQVVYTTEPTGDWRVAARDYRALKARLGLRRTPS